MNQPKAETEVSPQPLPFYSTHDNYGDLVAGAHRRRVTSIGAPALTRHLVFWNPIERPDTANADQRDNALNGDKRPDPPNGGQATRGELRPNAGNGDTAGGTKLRGRVNRARTASGAKLEEHYLYNRKMQADQLVAAIYRVLRERKKEGRIAGLRLTHPSTGPAGGSVPLFCYCLSELNGKFRHKSRGTAKSDSYRAIKFYFSWQGLRTVLSMELHVEFITLTAVIDLSAATDAGVPGAPGKDEPDVRASLAEIIRLYETADGDAQDWRRLHQLVYYRVWESFEDLIFKPPGIDALRQFPGVRRPERFVDFRGLILAVDPPRADEGQLKGNAGKPLDPDTMPVRLRPPFRRFAEEGTGNERDAVCRTKDFDRIWPFLKSGFDDEITEFTLSRYLKGRAFFATALAEQRGMVSKPGSGPLCYIVLEDTLNTWQLGRLIYRMHRAGTARVAAAMHFDKIQKANGVLGQIEQKLQESLRNAIPLRDQDEDKEDEAREGLRSDNDAIDQMLAGLPSAADLDGSLDFRIERSRYYVSQFERITKSLRIKRVQGFQTYIEFVQQRLGPVFEYIDRIGQRHARVQSDRGLLLRRLLTLEALYEERVISRAQRVADGALFGILGPYYLLSLVEQAWPPISTYFWRVGLAYAIFYVFFVALNPKRKRDHPIHFREQTTADHGRIRAQSAGDGVAPRDRRWFQWSIRKRVAISLLIAFAIVTPLYWAMPDSFGKIHASDADGRAP